MTDINLTEFQSQEIIESLKSGIPNISAVSYINVDIAARKLWFDDIVNNLENFIKKGGSKVRFINGQYGNGKTHLLSMIKHKAKELNYAVSYVNAEDIKLSRYDELYKGIIKYLETKDNKDNVFKILIEKFSLKIKQDVEKQFDDSDDQSEYHKEIKRKIKDFLSKLTKCSANFQSALKNYMINYIEAPNEKDWENENETILRWFSGEKLPLKEIRAFQIYALNDKDNARESIKAVIDILKNIGYSGLVILVDEAERILSQSPTVSKNAYNNIRHILDSADGGGEINHAESCYIFIASTPEMLDDKKGYKSYPALYDRIKQGLASKTFENLINPRANIVDLEKDEAQVQEENLIEIMDKIIKIHSIAYDWIPPEKIISKRSIKELAKKSYNIRSQMAPLRATVKMMVEILDIAQSHPSFEPNDYILKPDTQEIKLWD